MKDLLRAKKLESSSAEMDPGTERKMKNDTKQQCNLTAKCTTRITACMRKSTASRLTEAVLHLCSALSRVLGPAFVSPVQESYRLTEVSPAKGQEGN